MQLFKDFSDTLFAKKEDKIVKQSQKQDLDTLNALQDTHVPHLKDSFIPETQNHTVASLEQAEAEAEAEANAKSEIKDESNSEISSSENITKSDTTYSKENTKENTKESVRTVTDGVETCPKVSKTQAESAKVSLSEKVSQDTTETQPVATQKAENEIDIKIIPKSKIDIKAELDSKHAKDTKVNTALESIEILEKNSKTDLETKLANSSVFAKDSIDNKPLVPCAKKSAHTGENHCEELLENNGAQAQHATQVHSKTDTETDNESSLESDSKRDVHLDSRLDVEAEALIDAKADSLESQDSAQDTKVKAQINAKGKKRFSFIKSLFTKKKQDKQTVSFDGEHLSSDKSAESHIKTKTVVDIKNEVQKELETKVDDTAKDEVDTLTDTVQSQAQTHADTTVKTNAESDINALADSKAQKDSATDTNTDIDAKNIDSQERVAILASNESSETLDTHQDALLNQDILATQNTDAHADADANADITVKGKAKRKAKDRLKSLLTLSIFQRKRDKKADKEKTFSVTLDKSVENHIENATDSDVTATATATQEDNVAPLVKTQRHGKVKSKLKSLFTFNFIKRSKGKSSSKADSATIDVEHENAEAHTTETLEATEASAKKTRFISRLVGKVKSALSFSFIKRTTKAKKKTESLQDGAEDSSAVRAGGSKLVLREKRPINFKAIFTLATLKGLISGFKTRFNIRPLTPLRRRVYATYLGNFTGGFSIALWAPLIPYLQNAYNLTNIEIGNLVLFFGVGSVVGMISASIFTEKLGSRANYALSSFTCCASIITLSYMPHYTTAVGLVLIFGFSIGCLEVGVSIYGAYLEKTYKLFIMAPLHASYSLGEFIGSVLVLSLLFFSVPTYIIGTMLIGTIYIVIVRFIKSIVNIQKDNKKESRAFAMPCGAVIPLSLIVAITYIVGGAMIDWSALFLTKEGNFDLKYASSGYLIVTFCMLTCRIYGSKIIKSFGPFRTAFYGAILMITGLVSLVTFENYVLMLLSFVLIGTGMANISPLCLSATTKQNDMPLIPAVATVSITGYTGLLLAPASLGYISHLFNLSAIFIVLAALCIVSASLIFRVRNYYR